MVTAPADGQTWTDKVGTWEASLPLVDRSRHLLRQCSSRYLSALNWGSIYSTKKPHLLCSGILFLLSLSTRCFPYFVLPCFRLQNACLVTALILGVRQGPSVGLYLRLTSCVTALRSLLWGRLEWIEGLTVDSGKSQSLLLISLNTSPSLLWPFVLLSNASNGLLILSWHSKVKLVKALLLHSSYTREVLWCAQELFCRNIFFEEETT